MRKESSHSDVCQTAAVRVQYWFRKDRPSLMPMEAQELRKKYKYDLVKPLRIPFQITPLPLKSYFSNSKKKRSRKTLLVTRAEHSKSLQFAMEGSHCSVNQKNINHLIPSFTLSSARVAYLKLREHFLVPKKLKGFAKQRSHGSTNRNVVAIKSSDQEDLSQHPYIQEWQQSKQERHFPMDRVIKYLVD